MDVQTKGSSALMDLVREKPLVLVAWLFAFALVYQFASNDIRYVLEHRAWQASPGTLVGRDFVNMFSAGHMMFDRGLTGIYDVNAYQAYQSALFDGRVTGHNYSYTPVSFFYVWLFALPPYPVAYLLWTGLTGAAFAFAARPYLRGAGLPTWFAVLTPAALLNVWAGHYGFLFGALWLGAWSLLDRRPRLAGVLVGLMIVKPHLAILMPLMLAARGAWRGMRPMAGDGRTGGDESLSATGPEPAGRHWRPPGARRPVWWAGPPSRYRRARRAGRPAPCAARP